MCGRYAFAPTKKQIKAQLDAFELPEDFQNLFNIAPTNHAWVRTLQSGRRLVKMQWGLVPSWSKEVKNNGKLFNARSEEIELKPSFKQAIQQRRCLIPADSFYEWRKGPGREKLPYRILLHNGALMWMAGIWELWQRDTQAILSFSILTTSPNEEMQSLHNRMPLILTEPEQQLLWLSEQNYHAVKHLMRPLQNGQLKYYRVSDRLNHAGTNDAHLQDEVSDVLRLFD